MSKEQHPPYNCENCGITHTSYEGQLEFAHKNRKARNILILIAVVSLLLFPVSMTVFDLIKDPRMLSDHVEAQRILDGYDIACDSEYGMQYCLIQSTNDNYVKYNSEKMVIQSKTNPCLNLYLETSEKITDRFMITNSSDINCSSSIEFPIMSGWYWFLNPVSVDLEGNYDEVYSLTKSKQWWDRSNCPEEFDENGNSKRKSFCNWWLDL